MAGRGRGYAVRPWLSLTYHRQQSAEHVGRSEVLHSASRQTAHIRDLLPVLEGALPPGSPLLNRGRGWKARRWLRQEHHPHIIQGLRCQGASFGDRRKAMLQDLAILLSGRHRDCRRGGLTWKRPPECRRWAPPKGSGHKGRDQLQLSTVPVLKATSRHGSHRFAPRSKRPVPTRPREVAERGQAGRWRGGDQNGSRH